MNEDPWWNEGARAHYEEPLYYDQTYRRRREDVRFYVEECAEKSVLELGCGSGRVSFALAKAGASVVAVDAMVSMLDRLEERLQKMPRRVRENITTALADLRTFSSEARFERVIAPFNVFMHLYTRQDIEAALKVVREHLAPGGRFIFDVRMPNPYELSRDPDRVYKGRTIKRPKERKRYRYRERFDYDGVSQIQTIDMAFVGEEDPLDLHVTPLTQRQFFPAELEALLHYNGFEMLERYGDFEREELDDASESQVIIAGLRG